MPFTHQDRAAIGLFLTDVQHHKDVKRNFKALSEKYTQAEMLQLVDKLEKTGILTREDAQYLVHRIEKIFEQ